MSPELDPALGISAILPCFEERGHLALLVERLESTLTACVGHHFEVILVATSAARDGTLELARRLEAGRPRRRRLVIQPAEDLGYGRALTLGLRTARWPWVFIMDADGQFDPQDLTRFTNAMRRADFISGRRNRRRDSRGRVIAGVFYRSMVRLVMNSLLHTPRRRPHTGCLPRDVDCGFKLIRRECIAPGGRTPRSRTGVWNAEVILTAAEHGARFMETPVQHYRRASGVSRYTISHSLFAGWPRPGEAARQAVDLLRLALARIVPGGSTAGPITDGSDKPQTTGD